MARKTIYEPHPVSPERKAELLSQGYRIIDARFAPVEQPSEVGAPDQVSEPVIEQVSEKPKKRGRPSKVAPEAQISDKADTPSEE